MKGKKKKLDKRNENLKSEKIARKQNLQEKGITLIALVVTIVILLILAGVTLNIALSDNGLFNKAKKAADDYEEAQDKEASEIDKIDYEFQDTQDELAGKVVLNGKYSEKNGVNMPKLVHTGLTAVKFNEVSTVSLENSSNIVQNLSDDEIQKDNWYDYSKQQWANAQTVDGSLWVWIPRFAYNIKYNNTANKSAGGTIDIVFLKGTTDEPAPRTAKGEESKNITIKRATDEDIKDKKSEEIFTEESKTYIVHPAFTNESSSGYANGGWDKEISGFWMSKFEAGYAEKKGEVEEKEAKDSPVVYTAVPSDGNTSSETYENKNFYGEMKKNQTKIKYPTFKANRPSFNLISIGDAYNLCRNLTASKNPYGFMSNVDSHMIKNSEWGAVVYLSWSKYGNDCGKINFNKVKVEDSADKVTAVTGYGIEKVAGYDELVNENGEGNWKSTEGKKATTTGNITGIYDLLGGLQDRTVGYIIGGNNYSLYAGSLKDDGEISTKYKTVYEKATDNDNFKAVRNLTKKGEAIWETSSTTSQVMRESDWQGFTCWFLRK